MSEKKAASVRELIARMFLSGVVIVVLVFVLIRPSWLAHFLAASFFLCFGTVILFFYGFHPRSSFIGSKTKLARQSPRAQNVAQRIIRFLVICFACFLSYFVDLPILSDWSHFAREGRPVFREFKGRVNHNDILFGAFFIDQTLRVTRDDQVLNQTYFALFFPRVAHYGHVYWFLTAPKSGLVLDWQPADESAIAPKWK